MIPFASLHIQTDDEEDVFDLLAGDEAFVSAPIVGWVGVFDRLADEGDLGRLADLAARISGPLNCAALALFAPDDMTLFYLLFENGDLVDEYASDPDFYEESTAEERLALRGNVESLQPYCVPGAKAQQLRSILDAKDLGSTRRCSALAKQLGIENALLGYSQLFAKTEGADVPVVGWEYFALSPAEEGDEVEFVEAPDPQLPSSNGHQRDSNRG